jgi:chemotaxis protein methyltransferase CheR
VIQISQEELRVFAQLIYGLCGIVLDDSKAYLLESRLVGMLRETQSKTFGELFYAIRADATRKLQRQLIDQITTGETLFFRDQAPFELLQHKILPDLIDRRTRTAGSGPIPIRIWSAACSNGQEVYSIAMVLKELLGNNPRFNIRLMGTDISDQAVSTASRGRYSRIAIERGLPPDRLNRYFQSEAEGTWKVKDELRAMASFRTLNLMEDFTALGRFDIIFCRNVAIYFNDKDRQHLFNRMERVLEPDGYLMIGATESLSGFCPQYQSHRYLRSVYYQTGAAPTGPPLR